MIKESKTLLARFPSWRRRHSISTKLVVLCLAFALPLGTLLGFFVGDRLDLRREVVKEIEVLQTLEPIRELRGALLRARGLSVSMLRDGVLDSDELETRKETIDRLFDESLAMAEHFEIEAAAEGLGQIQARWLAFRDRSLENTYTEASYTTFVNRLDTLLFDVGAHSPLILDAEPDAYWLAAALILRLAPLDAVRDNLAGHAMEAAARIEITSADQTGLVAMTGQQDAMLEELFSAYRRSSDHESGIGMPAGVATPLQVYLTAHQRLLDIIELRLLQPGQHGVTRGEIGELAFEVEQTSQELWEATSEHLQGLLHARIGSGDQATAMAVLSTLAALVVAIGAAGLVIRSIRRPLRRAVGAATRLAKGELDVPIEVESDDEIGQLLGVVRDVTDQLSKMALFDALTGLPNRTRFAHDLEQALVRARRNNMGVGVVFMDLDRFKEVNDTLGHSVGDALLAGVSKRISKTLRSGDVLARFAGDEFTLMLTGLNTPDEAIPAVERALDALRTPFRIDGRELVVTASAGIAYSSGGASSPEELLRRADTALYRAKEDGRDRHEVFAEDMADETLEQMQMISDLRQAIDNDDLEVHFQPLVRLHDGSIVGVEALARWNRPGHGAVPPLTFIPAAENYGLIVALGRRIMLKAASQVVEWQQELEIPLSLAVNVSIHQLVEPDFVRDVAHVLQETGLEPVYLCLELTESTLLRAEAHTLRRMMDLRELGVCIAIDDFGTGYSSLSYLQRLPANFVKIDRAFINSVDTDSRSRHIVEAVVALARGLDMGVVAEGVESEGQRQSLDDMEGLLAQGYLFARPGPADDIGKLLSDPAVRSAIVANVGVDHEALT